MSKWGKEEIETLNAIGEIGFSGNILNIVAGDGRFNNKILEVSDMVVAIDIDDTELETLKNNCPDDLKDKLHTKNVDILGGLPFDNEIFDGIFCTGTLHLFDLKSIIKILEEIRRVLKKKGKIVLDFATDIERIDKNGKSIIFDREVSYNSEEAIDLFREELKDFLIDIKVSSFSENDLDDNAGYKVIKGKFLVISGYKKFSNDVKY